MGGRRPVVRLHDRFRRLAVSIACEDVGVEREQSHPGDAKEPSVRQHDDAPAEPAVRRCLVAVRPQAPPQFHRLKLVLPVKLEAQ